MDLAVFSKYVKVHLSVDLRLGTHKQNAFAFYDSSKLQNLV